MAVATAPQPVGEMLRAWRQRRRLSQLELALEADISARHVSFLETGRSMPSRPMLIRLAERLDIPLRERNALLVAAGYAPAYPKTPLDAPDLRAAREAVDLVLKGHEPYPALAVDRHWTLVTANSALAPLLAGIAPELLKPPVNALRLSLHPDGLAPRIANLGEWRAHILARLQRQVDLTADPALVALHEELRAYGRKEARATDAHVPAHGEVFVPLRLRTDAGELAFLSTTTVFGTAIDITLAELAIEAFFPADARTAAALRQTT